LFLDGNGMKPTKPRRLYLKAAEHLRASIAGGIFKRGERLPSETELAEELSVSRSTLREAFRLLEDEGLIMSRRGAGSFVRPESKRIVEGLEKLGSMTKSIRRAGFRAEDRMLSARPITLGESTAQSLQVETGSIGYMIETLRLADDRPVIYSCDILPASLLTNIEVLNRRKDFESLLDFLWEVAGVQVSYCVEKVRILLAASPMTHLLSVPAGTPLLVMDGVAHDESDRVLYVESAYFASEIYDFVLVRRP